MENHIPLGLTELTEEVGDDVPGLLQFRGDENPEVEWNIQPQTLEEEEQHAEPHTPPQQVLSWPRTPPAWPWRSARKRRPADRNQHYQQTLDKEADQQAQTRPPTELKESETPGLEMANSIIGELLDDNAFFAGLANTGPSNETLPWTLKEAFLQSDVDLWKSALEEELLSLKFN